MPTYVLGYKDIKTRIPPVRVLRGGGGEGSIDSARQVQTEGSYSRAYVCSDALCKSTQRTKPYTLIYITIRVDVMLQHTCVSLLNLSLSYVASKKLGAPP